MSTTIVDTSLHIDFPGKPLLKHTHTRYFSEWKLAYFFQPDIVVLMAPSVPGAVKQAHARLFLFAARALFDDKCRVLIQITNNSSDAAFSRITSTRSTALLLVAAVVDRLFLGHMYVKDTDYLGVSQ